MDRDKLLEWATNTFHDPLAQALKTSLACALVDLKTKEIVATTPLTPAMFGYDENELDGQDVSVLVPKEYRERHKQYMDTYAENPQIRYMGDRKLPGVKKDGGMFSLSIWLLPVTEVGGTGHVLCLFFT